MEESGILNFRRMTAIGSHPLLELPRAGTVIREYEVRCLTRPRDKQLFSVVVSLELVGCRCVGLDRSGGAVVRSSR